MQSHRSGMGNRPQRLDDVDVSEVPLTDMTVRSQPLAVCPSSTPSWSPSCGARPAGHAHRRLRLLVGLRAATCRHEAHALKAARYVLRPRPRCVVVHLLPRSSSARGHDGSRRPACHFRQRAIHSPASRTVARGECYLSGSRLGEPGSSCFSITQSFSASIVS
jgi:hypothetical protein